MFDFQVVFQIVVGVALTVAGYLYRELKGKVDKTHEEFLLYRTFVAEHYVSNDQLTKAVDNLNKSVEGVAAGVLRIETRINNQIDRRSQT